MVSPFFWGAHVEKHCITTVCAMRQKDLIAPLPQKIAHFSSAIFDIKNFFKPS
jgi:hypothetical protein